MVLNLSIPDNATVLPAKGSTVAIGDELFAISSTESLSVNVTSELSIKNEDIFHHIKKTIGDSVEKGEILAQKKKLVGTKTVQSPVAGTISGIDHNKGNIVINTIVSQETQTNASERAFFSGKLTAVDNAKQTISIEIPHAIEISTKSIQTDFGGELFYFSNESFFYTATEKDFSGKIVCIEELKNYIAAKCETLEAGGFVYVTGEAQTDVPKVRIEKNEFDRLVKAKKRYILFSCHEKKAVIYEDI